MNKFGTELLKLGCKILIMLLKLFGPTDGDAN